MEERYMIVDVLEEVKKDFFIYAKIISECENINIRQEIQEIRNNQEALEYELLKIAEVKDYYKNALKATENDKDKVKKELND